MAFLNFHKKFQKYFFAIYDIIKNAYQFQNDFIQIIVAVYMQLPPLYAKGDYDEAPWGRAGGAYLT